MKVKFHHTDRWEFYTKIIEITFYFFVREGDMTIPHGDVRNVSKIARILARKYPEEITVADVPRADFALIQERHINNWRLKYYIQKIPVRSIGIQVI